MIVDDEAPAREGLRLRLRHEPDVLIIGEYGDASLAIAALRADPPDLLFLDIEMPGIDGFTLLQRTDENIPAVIFVTAHDAHAVRAFEVRALDYLMKPVEQERLHEALERAREHLARIKKGEIADRMHGLLRELETDAPSPHPQEGRRTAARIAVRKDGAIQFVDAGDIAWIDAAGDTVRIRVGTTVHVLHKTMGEMLSMLDPSRFVRIHRSTIVNLDHVRELQPYFHGEYVVLMINGATLKLSRSYRGELARLLGLKPG